MQILIVDDEPLVRTSITRMIRTLQDSYNVKQAEDGEEAIELLKEHVFDLVITDIRMPVVDGIELAAYINKNYPGSHVVLLTGYAEFDYALSAIRQGVYDYLLKPASKESIIETIKKVENELKEKHSHAKIVQLREKNILEKRIQDLLYEIPVPHYDTELFPSFDVFNVFSISAGKGILWEKTTRFFIKNVLQEKLSEVGVPVIIVEERHVTTVLFAQKAEMELLQETVLQGKQIIQNLLKIELDVGFGGSSSELSDIHLLYMKSLKELGLLDFPQLSKDADSMHRLIRASLEYIEQEYASDLSLVSIADRLYVNPNYLSGLFKAETGFTFTQHLIHYRIEQAKKLLRETNLKIYQICEQVGYSDQAYFSRLFKAAEGISPYEYREQSQD